MAAARKTPRSAPAKRRTATAAGKRAGRAATSRATPATSGRKSARTSTAKPRSRSGPRFYQGDDLTKTAGDRKRGGAKYESWERK